MTSFKSVFISVFLGAVLITVVLILNAKRPAMAELVLEDCFGREEDAGAAEVDEGVVDLLAAGRGELLT